MLIDLFKSKTPLSVFSLPLLIAGLCISILFKEDIGCPGFFVWQQKMISIITAEPWLNYLITVVLVSTNAHQLNNLFNQHSFYSKTTFLAGLIYVISVATFDGLSFSPQLISHLFLIFSLMMILHLRRQEPAKALIFKAGLSLGVAVLFSPTLTPILLGPWIALAIFRPFVWREWLMLLLGFVLPHLYHAAIYFLATGKYMVELTGLTLGDSELNLSAIDFPTGFFLVCLSFTPSGNYL